MSEPLHDVTDAVTPTLMPRASFAIAKLAGALAKAQGQMANAVKDTQNTFFKSRYADLASCWDACRKPLADNGLAVIQLPTAQQDTVTVTTILVHESGESIAEALTLPVKEQTPQALGSALTYARRYGLCALVGIAPEDDDAESATAPMRGNGGNGGHARTATPFPVKPTATAKPEGFDDWLDTLTAVADSGELALKQTWEASSKEYRRYLTDTSKDAVASLKQRAARADEHAARERTGDL